MESPKEIGFRLDTEKRKQCENEPISFEYRDRSCADKHTN